jgi:hypothetical protein
MGWEDIPPKYDHEVNYVERKDPMLEIQAIKRLRLRPGDIIVLKTQKVLSHNAFENIRSVVADNFPGHKVLVLEEGMDIEVISKEVQ